MKLNYIVFCDSASIDTSGKVNLIGIFDRIQSSQFPTSVPLMQIATEVMDVTDENLNIKILVTKKDSNEVVAEVETIQKMNLANGDRYRLLAKADSMIFPEPGDYNVLVDINGEKFMAPSPLKVVAIS